VAAEFAQQALRRESRNPLRIENTARANGATGRSGVSRSAGNGGFFVSDDAPAARVASMQPIAQSSGIDALLALQAVEDPLFAKKKAVRRGNALLDTLEQIKADMLIGQVSEGRLSQLMVLIGQARQRNLPGLDDVLDDIELRARVELAKFGRYPGA
jgi:hypothetical protein